ncbi:MAG: hypothetical protein QOG82_1652 [Actinomycetota bacterium]|nr:hypothetical protein [Actinomycetota bacterium]
MRVLFTTTPGWGHIHPMVPLARAFVDRGDEVAWAATAGVAPRLEREGFTVHPAGQSSETSFGEAMRRFPEIQDLPPAERPNAFFPQFFGAVLAPAMVADLLPVARAFEPEVLVCDQAELGGPIAAALLGVPNVTHSFGGLIPAVRMAGAARAVAPIWEAHGLDPRPYAGTYDHLYLDIYPPSMQAADVSHVPFSQHLRPETFVTGEEVPLPPLVTESTPAPLVYVTFGTAFNSNPELVSTVLAGVRDLPVRVVLTVGPSVDPDAVGPQPANVHVARYIPQTQLLPYCQAVVSHAGSGTLLAALARGLPQLCLPQGADQFANADACVAAAAGRALHPGTVTVESVRAEMELVLADAAYRAAAERIAAEILAMPSPAEVADVMATRFGGD